ncbi:MGMT family protein [Sanguibacter antarcticus]|uniref:Alkylated DNA nucleotide flippase Atl1 n=1 Tax=Sanguibacter antarcticus TaxID=372484 RepID=A0A2A9E6S4_9MICO|nr:MGMT family protein [Sanguibacter antarcticus]PFG34543.1 alkylated DNA nucleotide flippase Atl1 [Sanguibacter antarcticus]
MASELVFTVDGSQATPAESVTLADAGLRERDDLQEWVVAHPQILGPGVMVITLEFDRWWSGSGTRERDRLDVLGLGTDGRLVVAELKRDRAPDTVEMQAIKYAAMASRFTEESLVDQLSRFRTRQGLPADEDTVRELLATHVGGELDAELLKRPRIVLVAGAFPPVVTATAVWLTDMGLDVALQRVQAYRTLGGEIVITVSQLFPVPDVEELMVSPLRAKARADDAGRRRAREKSTVAKLVDSAMIPDGTTLRLRPVDVDPDLARQVEEWVSGDPRRGRATWSNRRSDPIEWEYAGRRGLPTPITQAVLLAAAGVESSVGGAAWWILPDGRTLSEIAGTVTVRGGFDWSMLHTIMAAIPAGRWTTYGDLAALVGTAAQPVGTHIGHCADCPDAQRVLGADGRVSESFAWTDPDDHRDPLAVLRAEGVRLDRRVADRSQQMSLTELEELTEPG